MVILFSFFIGPNNKKIKRKNRIIEKYIFRINFKINIRIYFAIQRHAHNKRKKN